MGLPLALVPADGEGHVLDVRSRRVNFHCSIEWLEWLEDRRIGLECRRLPVELRKIDASPDLHLVRKRLVGQNRLVGLAQAPVPLREHHNRRSDDDGENQQPDEHLDERKAALLRHGCSRFYARCRC